MERVQNITVKILALLTIFAVVAACAELPGEKKTSSEEIEAATAKVGYMSSEESAKQLYEAALPYFSSGNVFNTARVDTTGMSWAAQHYVNIGIYDRLLKELTKWLGSEETAKNRINQGFISDFHFGPDNWTNFVTWIRVQETAGITILASKKTSMSDKIANDILYGKLHIHMDWNNMVGVCGGATMVCSETAGNGGGAGSRVHLWGFPEALDYNSYVMEKYRGLLIFGLMNNHKLDNSSTPILSQFGERVLYQTGFDENKACYDHYAGIMVYDTLPYTSAFNDSIAELLGAYRRNPTGFESPTYVIEFFVKTRFCKITVLVGEDLNPDPYGSIQETDGGINSGFSGGGGLGFPPASGEDRYPGKELSTDFKATGAVNTKFVTSEFAQDQATKLALLDWLRKASKQYGYPTEDGGRCWYLRPKDAPSCQYEGGGLERKRRCTFDHTPAVLKVREGQCPANFLGFEIKF